MNCFNHSETPAVAYCRACGKALCTECKRTAQGTIFCDEHAPAAAIEGAIRQAVVDRMAQETAAAAGPPPPAGSIATGDVSPGLACLLGFIPGVGAIYNGQYAKGLVHAIIFGLRRETRAGWLLTAAVFGLAGLTLLPVVAGALALFRDAKAHVIVKPPSLHEFEHSLRWNVVLICAAAAWLLSTKVGQAIRLPPSEPRTSESGASHPRPPHISPTS